MFTEFQVNEAHFKAFQEVIARHTVAIMTNGGLGIATGTLLSYGPVNLILTANHNLDETLPSEIRFGFKPEGNFQETSLSELPTRAFTTSPGPVYALEFRGDAVRDEKNDIAALVLEQGEKPRGVSTFYDASALKPVGIPNGASILMLGFPVGFAAYIGQGRKLVGATPDHLRYDSTLNTQKYLPSSYDPECEFLLEYKWIEDGLLPHGFSGAATWGSRELPATSAIWTPNPVLVGVITGYLREQRLLVVAGLRAVSELLSRL